MTLFVRAPFYLLTTLLSVRWALTIDPAYWWALLFPLASAICGRLLWDPVPHELELIDDQLVVRRFCGDPVVIHIDSIRGIDLARGTLRLRDSSFEKLPLIVCRLHTGEGLVRYAGEPLAGRLATLVAAERPDLSVGTTSIARFDRPDGGADIGLALHYRANEVAPVVVALAQIVLAGGALYVALRGLY
ncbi:MAG: hypothetical protein ACRBI6_10650 [Acidimicrobiales bacterium]